MHKHEYTYVISPIKSTHTVGLLIYDKTGNEAVTFEEGFKSVTHAKLRAKQILKGLN